MKRLFRVANVSFAVGIASGVGAVIAYFASPRPIEATPELATNKPRLEFGISVGETSPLGTLNGTF